MCTDLLFLELVYWFLCMNFAAYKVSEYKYMYDCTSKIELAGVFVFCTAIAPVGAVIDLFKR